MSPRIAHVFPDSPFLPFTLDVFESVAPGANTFLVYNSRGDLDRHRRAGTESTAIEAIGMGDAGVARIAEVVAESDVLIAHSMTAIAARAVIAAPERVLRVWSGWGGDYYGSNTSRMAGLLGPESAKYFRSTVSAVGTFMQPYRRFRASGVLRRAAAASDVFSAPIPEDLDVLTHRFPGFRGDYAQLNYASVEDTFAVGAHDITGDDILVGNSATMTNNHFEVLETLAAADVDGRRVIVPLSYGDSAYADEVVRRGTRLLGSDFVPLRDFMPLDEYQAILAACSVSIMGHKRQQGVGNAASALWAGAHLFLDPVNPISRFLAARGSEARSIAELAHGIPSGRVDDEKLERDRTLMRAFWGRDVVLANTRALLERAAR